MSKQERITAPVFLLFIDNSSFGDRFDDERIDKCTFCRGMI